MDQEKKLYLLSMMKQENLTKDLRVLVSMEDGASLTKTVS